MVRRIKCFALLPVVFVLAACAAATAPVPEKTRASPKVQGDVMEIIQVLEAGSGERCERKVVDTEVVKKATAADYTAIERWTIDRCGKPIRYLVTFKPGPSGGVDFTVRPEQ
ncbi:MAG TPA: hypothetical protein VGL70_20840 [Candidatus Binatia bacterium]|jgi:hypothetical protein